MSVINLTKINLLAMLKLRDLRVVLILGFAVIFAGNLWFGAPFAARGVLGTWFFDVDGSLTYGLGIVFIGSAIAAAITAKLDDEMFAFGVRAETLLVARVFACCLLALLTRPAVVLVEFIAGAVDSLFRDGHVIFGSPFPIDYSQQTIGELRVFGIYLVAATMGAGLAGALRSRLATTLVAGSCVVLYLPFLGSIFSRARAALVVLKFVPFGEIRAVLSENAGLFGDSSAYNQRLDHWVAAGLVSAWLFAFIGIALLRSAKRSRYRHRRTSASLPIALGLVCAGLLGGVLPPALSAAVPWQWRPAWRQAQSQGWASNQVATIWLNDLREKRSGRDKFFARGDETSVLSAGRLKSLGEANSITAQSSSLMPDPLHVQVTLEYRPCVETGNICVRSAWIALSFVKKNSRYLIARVDGPSVAQAEVMK